MSAQAHVNDAILAATNGPTVPDGLLGYYRAHGATSGDRTDAERQFLDARGATGGTLQDAWRQHFGTLGLAGALDDQRHAYWSGLRAPSHALLVGQTGTEAGFRPFWHPSSGHGRLEPPAIGGLPVYDFAANTAGNVVVLDLGRKGGRQAGSVTAYQLTVGAANVTVTWNGTRYQGIDAPFVATVHAAIGTTVTLVAVAA